MTHGAISASWVKPAIKVGFPTPKESVHSQALASPGPGTQAGQVPRYCRLVKDDKAFRQGFNDRKPMPEPVGALLSSLAAATLGGDQRLFVCKREPGQQIGDGGMVH